MNTISLAVTTLVFACVFLTSNLGAQRWSADERLWYSSYSVDPHNGMGRRIARDTCHGEIWAVLGSRIWRSSDEGRIWEHVAFPTGADKMVYPDLLVRDCQVLFHYGTYQPQHSFRISTYERASDSWREVAPLGSDVVSSELGSVGMVNSTIIVSGIRLDGGLFISSDLGNTWESADIEYADWSNPGEAMFEVASSTVAIRRDIGFVEYNLQSELLRSINTPLRTKTYRYANASTIIACQNGLGDGSVSISTNRGDTWRGIKTITCVNTGRVMSADRNELKCVDMRAFGGVVTLFTERGVAISTTDAGLSWIERGAFDRDQGYTVWGTFDMDEQGNIIVVADHAVYVVPQGSDPMIKINSGAPRLQTVVRVNSCTYVGIGSDGLFRSSDCGTTWYQPPAPTDLRESSSLHEGGVHRQWIDRVSTKDGDVIVSTPEHRALYALHDEAEPRYLVPCEAYPGDAFTEESTDLVKNGAYRVQLHGNTLFDYTRELTVYENTTSGTSSRTFGRFPIALSITDDEWIVVSHNIAYSTDKGATWQEKPGLGLPRNAEGYIGSASQIVRLTPQTLLLGLRGLRSVENSETTVLEPGGLYRSDDNGKTWSPDDEYITSKYYVWSILKLDDNSALCTAGEVYYDKASNSYHQTNASVLRSISGGRMWSVVHSESRSQPAHEGRRTLLRAPSGNVLYGSIEDGVLESIDDGRTWSRLGGEELNLRCINDIATDINGKVYAATDKGLFVFDRTTGIAGNGEWSTDDRLLMTTSPVPAVEEISVRLSSPIDAGIPSAMSTQPWTVTVVDICGNAVLSQRGVGTTEQGHLCAFSTHGLPNGLYVIQFRSLTTSSSSTIVVQH